MHAAPLPLPSSCTIADDTAAFVDRARRTFEEGRTRGYAWRARQLEGILRMIQACEEEIVEALKIDLGKPTFEAFAAEVAFTRAETEHILQRLKRWMRPERVPTPLISQPGQSEIVREPLGVVLVIAPWNYPFHLSMVPLIGAVAAGNCVVLKPSETASATSAFLARRLPEYIDSDAIQVIEGGHDVATTLLAKRFDHIFYTGNGRVGRMVMRAAAQHLTPVTLELGGKSPCVIDKQTDIETAAKRIAFGKFYNAGQTCVAPDYVLVHEDVHDELVEWLCAHLKDFYGDDPQKSPDFGRVVNVRHLHRLKRLLEGVNVVTGGQVDESDRYLAPTIVTNVSADMPIMEEEIFGPILPIVPVSSMDKALAFVNRRPKPLALYVFSTDRATQDNFVQNSSSGAVIINHIWYHLAVPDLPFGGVGESGMGAYHGRHSFECFSHRKAVLRKPSRLEPPFVYPPFSDAKKKWIGRIL